MYIVNSNSPTSSQTPDLPPENEQVDIDFDDIQDRVDDEQEEEQPAPPHRERLPTILEDPEEEEQEQVEAQPSPAVRRRRRKREIASLLTDFGDYWKVPPTTRRRRSSRVRRKPQRYVP